MKQFFLLVSAALTVALFFTSCQKEHVTTEATLAAPFTIDESNYYTPNLSDFDIDMDDRSYWTTIPAGSTDALQAAIDNADPGGIIYLRAGIHRETQRVTVNKRVAIIGEDGAVLVISSVDTTVEVNPGLHVLNAPGTLIKNVDIEPLEASGWCGVMFENSPRSAILASKISNFLWGVLVEKSDQIAIIGNHFLDITSNGVLVCNGKSAYIADNEFEGIADIGLWACDEWGTMERNNFHDNVNGVLLCNWPGVLGVLTPSGEILDALKTCTGWKLRANKFTNHADAGLNVRDGSHWNMIEMSNEYSNNAAYDIRIPADEDLLPLIFIPAAYNNTIHAAPGVIIKDCGINNTIHGGTLVDTSLDPC